MCVCAHVYLQRCAKNVQKIPENDRDRSGNHLMAWHIWHRTGQWTTSQQQIPQFLPENADMLPFGAKFSFDLTYRSLEIHAFMHLYGIDINDHVCYNIVNEISF